MLLRYEWAPLDRMTFADMIEEYIRLVPLKNCSNPYEYEREAAKILRLSWKHPEEEWYPSCPSHNELYARLSDLKETINRAVSGIKN